MNFGQAAERLDIAQPGLSRRIKMLEQILQVTLFDRSRRRLRMTLAGEIFEADAQDHGPCRARHPDRPARGKG